MRRRLPLLPKARKRKRRVVVDTSVLVAGIFWNALTSARKFSLSLRADEARPDSGTVQ